MDNNITSDSQLAQLPSYVATQLEKRRAEWKQTEKECHEEGNMEYNADERMRSSLDNDIKMGFLNSALGYMGNYKWYDAFFGTEGKGLLINREVLNKAEKIAMEAVKTWRVKILG